MADEYRRARLRRDRAPRGLRRLMQRGQRVLHAGAVDALLLETGDDLRPAGAVCEQSVNEDDILRLRRCLGAGYSIEQGKGGASSDSPDQCPAVYHSACELYGGRRNRLPDLVAAICELWNFPTFAALGAILVLSNVRLGSLADITPGPLCARS